LLTIALCLFSAATGQAAVPQIWDPGLTGGGGGGGAGAWNEVTPVIPTNWYDSTSSSDVAWTPDGDAEFDNTAGIVTVDVGGVHVHNMTFNNAAGSYDLRTNTITLDIVGGVTPTITVSNAAVTDIIRSSTIAGASGMTMNGPGTLEILNGANTYTGTTTITAGGTIYVYQVFLGTSGVAGALGAAVTATNNVVLDGGTIKVDPTGSMTACDRGITITQNGGTIWDSNNSSTSRYLDWSGNITTSGNGNRTLTVKNAHTSQTSAGHNTLSGTITDDGVNKLALTYIGSTGDRFYLNGVAKAYSGDTTVQSGNLWIDGGDNFLPYGAGKGDVYINSGATILSYGRNLNINGLNDGSGGGGTFTQNQSTVKTLTVGNGNASGSFSGAITAKFNLTKTGGGTETLSGANTYSGTTTVSGGTLKITGNGLSASSTIIDVASGNFDVSTITGGTCTLASGVTIRGNGTVLGNLSVQGTLAPGESAGQLTVNGNVTLSGNYQAEINGDVAGTSYDQLLVTGSNHTVTLGGTLTVSDASYTPVSTDMFWVVLNNDPSNTLSGVFSNYATSGSPITGITALAGYAVYYNADSTTNSLTGGNDVVIALVPEPATLTMLFTALAAMGGLTIVRKQRSK
jgi:autotransporter-associated beta strand protein